MKIRRVIVAAVLTLGLVGVSASAAFANNGVANNDGPGNFNNCTKFDQANTFGWLNMPNESFHACD